MATDVIAVPIRLYRCPDSDLLFNEDQWEADSADESGCFMFFYDEMPCWIRWMYSGVLSRLGSNPNYYWWFYRLEDHGPLLAAINAAESAVAVTTELLAYKCYKFWNEGMTDMVDWAMPSTSISHYVTKGYGIIIQNNGKSADDSKYIKAAVGGLMTLKPKPDSRDLTVLD